MHPLPLLQTNKTRLASFIQQQLRSQVDQFAHLETFEVVSAYLEQILTEGKLLRGSLFLSAITLFESTELTKAHLKIAAAFEFLHMGLLIHDDIMDKDEIRRGQPSAFKWVELRLKESDFADQEHLSKSAAICMGDICFFIGYKLFSEAAVQFENTAELLSFFAEEYVHVGLGQMQDVFNGHARKPLSAAEISQVHIYKTALYTISLPLKAAAIACNLSREQQESLYVIGKKIGFIFQIRDDYLNLFSPANKSGKSRYSDISENKETLFKLYTFEKLLKQERDDLSDLFGKTSASQEELTRVVDYMKQSGVIERVAIESDALLQEVIKQTLDSSLDQSVQSFLIELGTYLNHRKQ